MSMLTHINANVFSKNVKGLGELHMRLFDIDNDLETIYPWLIHSHAKYWGMQNYTLKQAHEAYDKLIKQTDYNVFIGFHNHKPAFLMEKYKAINDRIASYYDAKESDYGMHILIAPPEQKIHGFTKEIFAMVMDYFFSFKTIDRVVVEPDATNDKIHALNKKAGFKHLKNIQLPEKEARLELCYRTDYMTSKLNLTQP